LTKSRKRNVGVFSRLEGWYRGVYSWDIRSSLQSGWHASPGVPLGEDNRNNNTHVRSIHRSRSSSLFILTQRAKADYLKFTPSLDNSCSFIPSSTLSRLWDISLTMDRILSPHSPEVAAHNHLQWAFLTLSVVPIYLFFLRENWFSWDLHDINESLVSNCASYAAFERYTSGTDLYILPRTPGDLLNLL